jgi:soluble lytic murein transglycosylase
MLHQPKGQIGIAIGVSLSVLVIVLGLWAEQNPNATKSGVKQTSTAQDLALEKVAGVKEIQVLKALPSPQRAAKLAEITKSSDALERDRARYLLATDLMQQGQAKQGLQQLQDLEGSYAVMAAPVLLKRAQAQAQAGDRPQATATYQQLLQQHPKSPLAAEALIALGRNDGKYLEQAIAQFPAHPRTIELVQQRLKQNPNQPQLLIVLARHGIYLPGYTAILDKLVMQFAAQLKPEDWEAIGFGYWEKAVYGKAGEAYARAPLTPRNAYRAARGLQLGEKAGATQAYQRLVQSFPTAPETGQGLIRLSRITEPATAMTYLERAIAQFPDRAGEALAEKAKLLQAQNNSPAATQAYETLLKQFGTSEAAAELRWRFAQERAKAGDLPTAWKWAEPILSQNPESEIAPKAGFWMGKWAQQLGKQAEARSAYEWVLRQAPHSYYAWRSAAFLGWQVGDFTNVRQFNPPVARPRSRVPLPTGSETLKELHQLGQDQEAWATWQVEFQKPMQSTVAEQFTDGVMRLNTGDFLDGLFMVSYLKERENAEEQAEYRSLKQQSTYWQALYPFPFQEPIQTWSQARQLNPLLVTALIRQESRFMPKIESSAGAKGLMQVMPETAAWIAEKIKLKQYRLDDINDNIKLGTWYLDYTHQEYNNDSLLAVASYNAGPGAVADWLKKGISDPDAFVEAIPYEETRGYVKLVFENYWNYLRLYNPEIAQKMAQVSPG